MLDAKKAILEEQHRRLQVLREEERWEDLLQQLSVTLSCAADVLQQSLSTLHTIVEERQRTGHIDRPSPPGSHTPYDKAV
jgi:hypothetical protein